MAEVNNSRATANSRVMGKRVVMVNSRVASMASSSTLLPEVSVSYLSSPTIH